WKSAVGDFAWGAYLGASAVTRVFIASQTHEADRSDPVERQAWKRWTEVADRLGAIDGRIGERLKLRANETLCLDGPDPTESDLVLESIALVVTSLTWRPEDDTRSWLLRMFDNADVSASDLFAITDALANRTAAVGIDRSMILPANATDDARQALRARFAEVWQFEDAIDRDALLIDWAEVAGSFTDGAPSLERAVQMAHLNSAAYFMWTGRPDTAQDIFLNHREPIEIAVTAAKGRASQMDVSGDGDWARRYIEAKSSIPARLTLLEELRRRRDIGVIDAEILVRDATRGTPQQVRLIASERVTQFAGSVAIVNALLEINARLPSTTSNSELIASITGGTPPSVRSPSWRRETRRLLVEKLLEMLSTEGEYAVVDELAVLLARTYSTRSGLAPASPGADVPPANESANAIRARWHRAAMRLIPSEDLSLRIDEIDRRHQARLEMSRGLVQRFVVEQMACAELMAYVVGAELPARADAVEDVLEDLRQRRIEARHIFEQIDATERAILRLWMIRQGVDP
ncbi:MAG: hypothetical protein KDA28_12545, partial [Phycisphaerales bacterium]|nr:hypothetical protein [Phycisphaerales bacterium]